MFILYGLLIGVAIGVLVGGRPGGLAAVTLRWAPLAFAGLILQVLLFSAPVTERIGELGAPLYVASTALVLVAVLRNVRTAGMPLLALGASGNLAAITANGGYMPTTAAALTASGHTVVIGYSNSSIVADPALALLTDIFALPPWLPFANVFSVGDVLIGAGAAAVVAIAMRRGRPDSHRAWVGSADVTLVSRWIK